MESEFTLTEDRALPDKALDDMQAAKALLELIPRAMRSIRGHMRGFAETELTVPQFRVIARLARAVATNADLAEHVGVTPPTMSKMVDVLVKRNLVQREGGEIDRRQVWLSLTPRGKSKFGKLSHSVQETLAGRLAGISAQRKAALGEALALLEEVFSP